MASAIQTRQDLRDWILRKLGHDITDQEITPAQLEDAINDAIQEYIDVSGIGSTYKGVVLYEHSGGTITLPQNVKAVSKILGAYTGMSQDETSWNTLCSRSTLVGGGGSPLMNLTTLTIFNQYMSVARPKNGYLFEMTLDKVLHITPPVKIGSKIAIECFIELDMMDDSFVRHIWVKKYALSLAKYQWGFTMLKYGAVQIAGGNSIDYNEIMNEGKSEKEQLEEDLRNKYTFPAMFFYG